MSINYPQPPQNSTITNQVPIGGISDVLRSGDAYKVVGELLQRASYPDLSAAFPRNGSLNSVAGAFPGGFHVNALTYGNPSGSGGVFVAVGYTQGSTPSPTADYYVSADGVNWSKRKLPSSQIWSGIGYGNGKFIALASDGTVGAYSSDGYSWTAITLPSTSAWASPVYGAGIWASVSKTAGGSSALSSTDGVTWTPRSLPNTGTWSGLTFGAGTFFAWRLDSSAGATSTNGTSWTARTTPAVLSSASYAAGTISLFTATSSANGGIYTSPDAITWTLSSAPAESAFGIPCFGDGVVVAVGTSNRISTSYNGTMWSYLKTTSATLNTPNYSVYGDGRMILMNSGSSDSTQSASCIVVYAENITDSAYIYLSGNAGDTIRVK